MNSKWYVSKLEQLREQEQGSTPEPIRGTELLNLSKVRDVDDENSPIDRSGHGLCVTTTKYSDFWLKLASKVGGLLEELLFFEEFSQ